MTSTPCLKKTSHHWLAITLTHMNEFWYFLAEMLPIKPAGNQKTLYCATSNNLCFCTTWQNGETRKSHLSLNWTVLYAQCTCVLASWKKKMSSVMCFIASNICWDSDIPLILSTDFYSRLDEEQLPSFTQPVTAWQAWLTQSMWVTHSRMLCSLPRSCLVHPVDRSDSEGWFNCD